MLDIFINPDHELFKLNSKEKPLIMYENNRSYNLKNWIETFTNITNRSISQTNQLYYFLNGNLDKLIQLEINAISNYISGIPINNMEVNQILKLKPNTKHPKYAELLQLKNPKFHKSNKFVYSTYNPDYKSNSLKDFNKRGIQFSMYKLEETEALSDIIPRLINIHGDRLQYVYKDDKIFYNHVAKVFFERTHKKYQLNMSRTVQERGFENFKTFYLTSRDNTRRYLLKVGTSESLLLKDDAFNATFLLLLQQAVQKDIRNVTDFLMEDYDDNNLFLDIIDYLEDSKKTRINVLSLKVLETIPDNNSFVAVDYLPAGNYYGACGLFTRNSKDSEYSCEDAGKLVLSHIVAMRPLAYTEKDLLQSIKDKVRREIADKELGKLKKNATEEAKVRAEQHIENEYNRWLDKVVLMRQKIAFEYPVTKDTITIADFMKDNDIKLVRAIAV